MKQFYALLLAIFLFTNLPAQTNHQSGSRSQLNPAQFPFYHGVESGDPLTDRVILWTRITLDPPVSPVAVSWQIATDTSFNNLVNSGTTFTDSTKDYTIKIDATGLQPNWWYYYRFAYDSFYSIVGRTRTLPVGPVNNLRFAVASCQSYQKGYYNAHRVLSERNDIDAVLFLGDYTYENALDSIVDGRYHEPPTKTVQMIEYQMRQSQYKLDPDLQAAHQQFPWICIWDDHETANNSYKDGAKSHNTLTDGSWYDRKVNGVETYFQWMPIRQPDITDTFKIFRKFTWGNLLDLHMLDTRLYDRDKQIDGSTFVSVYDSALLDSTRTLMGPAQIDWLKGNLDSSQALWQIIGQQVMIAPLIIPAGVFGPDPVAVNPDQWDGYPFDREKLYNHILSHNIKNVVVLTGDIHTAWANDLPLPGYDTAHRQNSIGVEFVCTSISSGSDALPPWVSDVSIYSLADYVRYVNLLQHGFCILDITPQQVQSDYIFVDDVKTKNYSLAQGPSWYVNNGEKFLRPANSLSVALNTYPPFAPHADINTSAQNKNADITTIMIYPNPTSENVMLQFNAVKSDEVWLEVLNTSGQTMFKKSIGNPAIGINHVQFNISDFSAGYYVVKLYSKNSSKSVSVIKIN